MPPKFDPDASPYSPHSLCPRDTDRKVTVPNASYGNDYVDIELGQDRTPNNEDLFEDLSSESVSKISDPAYDRSVGSGTHTVVRVAACVAGGVFDGVMKGAKMFWGLGPKEPVRLSSSTPTPVWEHRPKISRKYQTADGKFNVALQQRRVTRRMTEPRLTGIPGPYGMARLNTGSDGRGTRSAGGRRPRRVWAGSASGLIEVSDGDDFSEEEQEENDYVEAKDAEYTAVTLQPGGGFALHQPTASHSPGRKTEHGPGSDSEKEDDSNGEDKEDAYSQPEGEDSDFEGAVVDWPLSRSLKRAHMEKMAAKRKFELREKEEKLKIEDERARRAKALIHKLRARRERERAVKERSDMPNAGTDGNLLQAVSTQDQDRDQEIFDPESGRYFSPAQYAREKERRTALMCLRYGNKTKKEETIDELLDPMAHLRLSPESRHAAQMLQYKDRMARKAAQGTFMDKIAKGLLKK